MWVHPWACHAPMYVHPRTEASSPEPRCPSVNLKCPQRFQCHFPKPASFLCVLNHHPYFHREKCSSHTSSKAFVSRWRPCEKATTVRAAGNDCEVLVSNSPADTSVTQPLYPRLRDHHRRGGGKDARARDPGCLP